MNPRWSLIAVLCLFSSAWAAEIAPPEAAKQRRFTLDQLWSLTRVSDVQVAPDGLTVAVVLKRPNPAANRYDQFLTLINITDGRSRIVFQGTEVAEPRWTPADSRLAFLARDEKSENTQVFLQQTSMRANSNGCARPPEDDCR